MYRHDKCVLYTLENEWFAGTVLQCIPEEKRRAVLIKMLDVSFQGQIEVISICHVCVKPNQNMMVVEMACYRFSLKFQLILLIDFSSGRYRFTRDSR